MIKGIVLVNICKTLGFLFVVFFVVEPVQATIIEFEVTYDSKFILGLDTREEVASFDPVSFQLFVDLTPNHGQSYHGESPFGGYESRTAFDYSSITTTPFTEFLKKNIHPTLDSNLYSQGRISETSYNMERLIDLSWQLDGFLIDGESYVSSSFNLGLTKLSYLLSDELHQYTTEAELLDLFSKEFEFDIFESSHIQGADSSLNIIDFKGIEYSGYARFVSGDLVTVPEPSTLFMFSLGIIGLVFRSHELNNQKVANVTKGIGQ
jgi:hypothetical protein